MSNSIFTSLKLSGEEYGSKNECVVLATLFQFVALTTKYTA